LFSLQRASDGGVTYGTCTLSKFSIPYYIMCTILIIITNSMYV